MHTLANLWRKPNLECGDSSPLSLSSSREFAAEICSNALRDQGKESGNEFPHSKAGQE